MQAEGGCVTERSPKAYDWIEPWRNLAKLLNIILCHATGVLALAAIARGLAFGIAFVSHDTLVWTMKDVSVSLSDIIHYFDLAMFAVFLCVAVIDIVKWAVQR
jgi:hypothetical protein